MLSVGPRQAVAGIAEDLQATVQPLVDAHEGQVAVMIKHFDSNTSFEHRADEPMPTASLIKFPLMVATYQAINDGKLQLDQMITLRKEDKVPGSGVLTPHFSAGATISLRDAIQLMMAYSDNTATNLVIDQVGLAATTRLMEKLGCPNTKLHSKVFRRDTSISPERSRQFGLGSTSAADLVRLLEMLHAHELVSEDASEKMLAHMVACTDESRLTKLLPPGTKIAHKTGSVSAVRTAAGIIESPGGAIALAVLTSENKDRRWSNDNAGNVLCAKISLAAYQCFNANDQERADAPPVELSQGASGKLVEALQRTLNARLEPSPNIGVDGEFGPQTLQTVQRFQKENNLVADGKVSAETWQALGPLRYEGPPVPEPEIINQEPIDKSLPDQLTGTPFVTCKAWAMADAETGELLWGHDQNKPLDIASTTKIMVGYLVATLAEQDPRVLDEIVTFSQRADDTSGSTSGIRTGEQLPVRELLYGLLLPSGNDASVALAEHFGGRLVETVTRPNEVESYDQFLIAMNNMAQELGMSQTSFSNTAGFTDVDHHASAADLLKLTWQAMQLPLFRKVVSTVQHGCTVSGPGGYRRNVLWRNTNRLLKIEGYDGVKTGTTNAAGSCLVSRGWRDGRSLILVVLGATSSDARYTDSRNLYRWAWNKLASSPSQPPTPSP